MQSFLGCPLARKSGANKMNHDRVAQMLLALFLIGAPAVAHVTGAEHVHEAGVEAHQLRAETPQAEEAQK